MPGEVFANDLSVPTAALIKTSECNLLTGRADDTDFNSTLSEKLDFWDTVTPDSGCWNTVIPLIHKNRFIRRYTRRFYSLDSAKAANSGGTQASLPQGYCLESVAPSLIREKQWENTEKVIEWMENWGDDRAFHEHGVGSYIHNGKTIVGWSLSDCSYGDRVEIGVCTDERFRKNGFGMAAVSATVRACFEHGYKHIGWRCVDTNKGSIAIAEKLGFVLQHTYDSFTTYPPIENPKDLSDAEWNEWGSYLEHASISEPKLRIECLFSYIKADNLRKAQEIAQGLNKESRERINLNGFVRYLHGCEMGSSFPDDWMKGDR